LNERRFAGMKSGRVGVVPTQARDGDMIAYLAGDPTSVVLRATTFPNPEGLEGEIIEAFKAKSGDLMNSKSPYVNSFMQLFEMENKRIGHAKLVGECYVEGVIGWSFKERHDDHEFKIFALHQVRRQADRLKRVKRLLWFWRSYLDL
jgi:hypothetical protein